MREYKGIDVFKFIMALFVVVLHTQPLYGINSWMNFLTAAVISRMAVPFFFTASGFLLQKQVSVNETGAREVLGRYIRKILGVYCIWTVIYMPIIIYDKILSSDDAFNRSILMVLRDFVFVGSYAHLWYLPAAAVGIIVVYTLKKYVGERGTAVILLGLFLVGLLTQSYFGLLTYAVGPDSILWKMMKAVKKVMVTCRNGVFFGSIFIYMGTWMAKSDFTLKKYKAVIGLAVSILLFYMEAAWLRTVGFVREEDMYLMLLPSVLFLTVLAVQTSVNGETVFLRRMSMNIYYVHILFRFIYREYIGENAGNNIGQFLFTLAGALSAAYLMYRYTARRIQ